MFPRGLPTGPFGRAWTEDESSFLRANAASMTSSEIAHHLARQVDEVRERMMALGLVPAAAESGVRLRVARKTEAA